MIHHLANYIAGIFVLHGESSETVNMTLRMFWNFLQEPLPFIHLPLLTLMVLAFSAYAIIRSRKNYVSPKSHKLINIAVFIVFIIAVLIATWAMVNR